MGGTSPYFYATFDTETEEKLLAFQAAPSDVKWEGRRDNGSTK